jgi:holo-[acyl-carrier protein] synthase
VIHGVGTDIVKVSRIQSGLDRYGERFARRILTAAELDAFREEKRPAHFLAKHFAAKEAVVKALGTGFRDGIKFADIHITHDSLGKPDIEYDGNTALLLDKMGVFQSHISLSDEHDYAIAFVILEGS